MKTILITGANSGIGEGLTLAYAVPGNHLLLIARDKSRLQKISEQCVAQGATVESTSLDVQEKTLMAEWIIQQDEKTPINLVIANAGISTAQAKKQASNVMSDIDQMIFDVNLQGVLNTIYPIIPRMQQRQSGQIVLMSSLASYINATYFAAYSASKVAVRTYGLALRGLLKKNRIRVNVICPGFIKTPLTDENDFHMPSIMSVAKATKLIVKGISKDHPLIVFPWKLYFMCRLYQLLPVRWQNRINKGI
jgi:short-subunit dehydrogenase